MPTIRVLTRCAAYVALAASLSAVPVTTLAQWVPKPGDGSISIGFQNTIVGDHLFSEDVDGLSGPPDYYVGGPGNRWYLGDVRGRTISASFSYGIWRGLAMSGTAAYMSAKYAGRYPEGPEDDGRFHGSLQDGSLTLEYMLPWRDFAITPSIGLRSPLRDYSTLGHVSVGKRLREFPVGVSVGRSLIPFLPRAFLAGSFAYSFVQNHHEHDLDQRHYTVSGGYLLSSKISAGGFFQRVETVDGLDWYSDITTEEAFHDHDVAANAKYSRVGGYLNLSLSPALALRIGYSGTVSGQNSHAANSFTFEPSWSFSAPLFR